MFSYGTFVSSRHLGQSNADEDFETPKAPYENAMDSERYVEDYLK